ncbi:MAG: hypothetical protein ABSH49_35385 [Bryobacteraceae bacterium]|jgi:hypothetical protein
MYPESTESQSKPRDPRALNAYRHGLTGQVHILTPEDQVAYDKHCRDTQQYFNPAGEFEAGLVQSIADGRWQLQRAVAIEDAIFALDAVGVQADSEYYEAIVAFTQGKTWLAHDKSLERIALYASRIQRRVEKDIAMFRQLQADRKAAFETAIGEAEELIQLAEKAGETYSPATDFPRELLPPQFDFSNPEIVRLIAHRRRLKAAQGSTPNPEKRLKTAA